MVEFSSKTVHCGKSYGRSKFGDGGRKFLKIGKFTGKFEISRNIGNIRGKCVLSAKPRVGHVRGAGQFYEFFSRGHLVDGLSRTSSSAAETYALWL